MSSSVMLLVNTLVTMVTMTRARTEYLVMLDETSCYQCQDPDGCQDQVVGAGQVRDGLNWTLERLDSLNIVNRDSYSLEVLDTCTRLEDASWQIIKTLGRLSVDGSINQTHPLQVLLASQLNYNLTKEVSQLQMTPLAINPTSSPDTVHAVSRLVKRLSWRQVIVVSTPMFSAQLVAGLAEEDICVLDTAVLPSGHNDKDVYTELVSGVAETGVTRVIVAGSGQDIAKLVRNVYELNVNMSVLAVPWDGTVVDMPGSDMEGVEVIQMVQTFYHMPEFMADNTGWSYEHVTTWEVVKAMYGLMVVKDVNVDPSTVKNGLQLSNEAAEFRIDQFDLRRTTWNKVGVYQSGDVTWTVDTSSVMVISDNEDGGCYECHCVNNVVIHGLGWRPDTWVTVLTVLASVGVLTCLLMSVFLCLQCSQVLEGSQMTTSSLLVTIVLLYVTLLPFCFLPGHLVCWVRELAPGATYTLVMAVMLSRSLLLATSDTDGLPGHASGYLQTVLTLVLVTVQVAVLLVTSLDRMMGDQHEYVNIVSEGMTQKLQCSHHGWSWLLLLLWPGILLLIQIILTPVIWRSRRNYREGVLFSVGSLCLCCVTVSWLVVYFICTELFGRHWEEIATASGLVSSATILIIAVFIPKIYMINKWGSGSEISLHLPATATSTLHTDTIDYVRGTDIYNDNSNTMLYDNNPGNRRGLSHILSQYQKTQSMYSDNTPMGLVNGLSGLNRGPHNNSTYKLDSNTEPDPNISWEPFHNGTSGSRSSQYSPNGGVSSMFISNMQGYGYNPPLDQQTSIKTSPSTKL